MTERTAPDAATDTESADIGKPRTQPHREAGKAKPKGRSKGKTTDDTVNTAEAMTTVGARPVVRAASPRPTKGATATGTKPTTTTTTQGRDDHISSDTEPVIARIAHPDTTPAPATTAAAQSTPPGTSTQAGIDGADGRNNDGEATGPGRSTKRGAKPRQRVSDVKTKPAATAQAETEPPSKGMPAAMAASNSAENVTRPTTPVAITSRQSSSKAPEASEPAVTHPAPAPYKPTAAGGTEPHAAANQTAEQTQDNVTEGMPTATPIATTDTAAETVTAAAVPTTGKVRGRLAPGQLRRMVHEYLGDHPDREFTPTELGHLFVRSSGAILNALEKLREDEAVTRTKDRPRTYRIAEGHGSSNRTDTAD